MDMELEEELLNPPANSGSEPPATADFSDGGAWFFHRLDINNFMATPLSVPLTQLIAAQGQNTAEEDGGDMQVAGEAVARPFVVLDVIWNLAFAVASVLVLLFTVQEKPSSPLRAWISGYAVQCALHVCFAYLEYRKSLPDGIGDENGAAPFPSRRSLVKTLETLNTIISSFWWVLGFYWIVVGGQALLRDSPHLYWLAVVLLAFDVFLMIICIGAACVIFIVIFLFIPLVAIIYAVMAKRGASDNDIEILPKYRFHGSKPLRIHNTDIELAIEAKVPFNNRHVELVLQPEDSECCICLSQYVEGAELCRLPCYHHFHVECISTWLRPDKRNLPPL